MSPPGPPPATARLREYLNTVKAADTFGPQVVAHRCLPATAASYAETDPPLAPPLCRRLGELGIARLYCHQDQAVRMVLAGEDVVVATPTASGKSLVYNLPVLQELYRAEPGHALYLFPLKALARDQYAALLRLAAGLEATATKNRPLAALFDGDTPAAARRRIRDRPPTALLSNPEMVHLSLLPGHSGWAGFFAGLRYVVIDEVHSYRGILGGHISWLLRRLQRIATHYGARPVFILLSATIGNPGELAEMLLGRRVAVVSESGAPQAEKNLLLLNPWGSAANAAEHLLVAAMQRGLRSIVYTKSRKMTELIHRWSVPRLGPLAGRLSAYRAGFLPEERREIETQLANGKLLGVVSTSALELGIDIGDLDICILVGYPGSILATIQRGGRVGRGEQPSATILIAGEDALDQYFMRQPDDFFRRRPEKAVLNPYNPAIIGRQLLCAAAELPLDESEILLNDKEIKDTVTILSRNGELLETARGGRWVAAASRPHQQISLRGGGRQLAIIDSQTGEIVGEIDALRGMRDCHPGAVYLHRATSYLVEQFDPAAGEVVVRRAEPPYHTRPLREKKTEILAVAAQCRCHGLGLSFGQIRVTERITGYQRWHNSSGKLLATHPLALPEQIIETEGLWLDLPATLVAELEGGQYHLMAAIHALEHALIALLPLFLLCDSNDLGGIATLLHPQTEHTSVFLYDGQAGGAGLCREAYHCMAELLQQTYHTVAGCPCDNGCPSCVHAARCGSGNRPIDRLACVALLTAILAGDMPTEPTQPTQPRQDSKAPPRYSPAGRREKPRPGLSVLPKNFCVFDLETIRSAAEVGGWGRSERMGMALAVLYDSASDSCSTFLEEEAEELVERLRRYPLVVGFNNKRFDNRVLSAYTRFDLTSLPALDLLEEVHGHLGYRLSLQRLATDSLGRGKMADGQQSLQWYREGRLDLIEQYCRQDVEITRDLLYYALEHGFLLFTNKAGCKVRLPLPLATRITALLARS
jgi:DEAD/DEAH box helicase domain-containing protein